MAGWCIRCVRACVCTQHINYVQLSQTQTKNYAAGSARARTHARGHAETCAADYCKLSALVAHSPPRQLIQGTSNRTRCADRLLDVAMTQSVRTPVTAGARQIPCSAAMCERMMWCSDFAALGLGLCELEPHTLTNANAHIKEPKRQRHRRRRVQISCTQQDYAQRLACGLRLSFGAPAIRQGWFCSSSSSRAG